MSGVKLSISSEWDPMMAKAAADDEKLRVTAVLRAGHIRKGSLTMGERSPQMTAAIIEEKINMDADEVSRRDSARKADGEMMKEQLRRMKEDSESRSLSLSIEAKERKMNQSRAIAAEEQERLRRIQERSLVTSEALSSKSDADSSKLRASAAAMAEQNRRIAYDAELKAASRAEEEQDRKSALLYVKAAEEAERERRMKERLGDDTIEFVITKEKHDRKRSIDMASVLIEEERRRRMKELEFDKSPDVVEVRDSMLAWVNNEVEKERGRRMSAGKRSGALFGTTLTVASH